MRPTMVAGNWKMNGLSGDAVHLTQAILHAGLEPMRPEVVIFPPFTLLHAVSQEAKSSALRWGGAKPFLGSKRRLYRRNIRGHAP